MDFLADSWPQVFDDSEARQDWLWQPQYDLKKLVKTMVENIHSMHLQS